jgi:hypothetical protein
VRGPSRRAQHVHSAIFDPLTVHTNTTWYVSSEFGIGILIVAIVLAVYFSSRRAAVEALPA